MSIKMMTKKCTRCHRTYSFNPSVGDMGIICKHCGYPQQAQLPSPSIWVTQVPKSIARKRERTDNRQIHAESIPVMEL